MPGIGGGGGGADGASLPGMGGGGGGADGLDSGRGGGGGPASDSEKLPFVGGRLNSGDWTAGEAPLDLSPVADNGRGGPMEPNNKDANWAAPAGGRPSSESSSESSLSEPHSSSVSGRFRDKVPVGCGPSGAIEAACVIWWKGLVDALDCDGATGADGADVNVGPGGVADDSEDCDIMRK